ncbi:MAG: branched-chain amino acid ABC transporter permease [Gammaproteobacteria bacterium]|nr:branched-chain amino acid ABC transporter permease [Gammaproteobacteria bacterium]MBU1440227.1 branched-chain amino acid ABC transporter permease [Gammaproteobacteria bacterium]
MSPSFRPALLWAGYALLLIVLPLVFDSSASVTLLSQMACAVVFCLAYNILLGQGGMLSFGHAVYYGMGAFVTMHAMQLAAAGALPLPLPLLPLAGGLAGLLAGAILGYVTTRRAGISFAMITFGVAELVFISTGMFPHFFGGDTGLSGTRTYGGKLFGLSFGPPLQVYYLIVAWVLLCTGAMYWFTLTPLGRIVNAVRDNPERLTFIGFNARRARYLAIMASGTFTGIAGALSAINFESATIESLGSAQSGTILLFTYIGGSATFAGPILGAAVGTLLTVLVSTFTKAWPLYLGLFFVLVVKFAPRGLAGLLADGWRALRDGTLRSHARHALPALAAALVLALAGVTLIELTYRRTLGDAAAASLQWLGMELDSLSAAPWLVALGVALVAFLVLRREVGALRGLPAPGSGT